MDDGVEVFDNISFRAMDMGMANWIGGVFYISFSQGRRFLASIYYSRKGTYRLCNMQVPVRGSLQLIPISKMRKPYFLLLSLLLLLLRLSSADIGTASWYIAPYTPTACFGSDFSQFPISNLFAAAGDGIWDNGAACGRQYLVRCINSIVPETCVPDRTIEVIIVDRAATSVSRPVRADSILVLSDTAFQTIAQIPVQYINAEFLQIS